MAKGTLIPAEIKAKAKTLYMGFTELKEIHKQTGVSMQTLYKWVNGVNAMGQKSWKREREAATMNLIRGVKEENQNEIAKIFKAGLPLIRKSIECWAETLTMMNKPLTFQQARELTDVLTAFDKLQRLDLNQPTEIKDVQVSQITPQQLREAVLKDAFLDYIPIETKATRVSNSNADNGQLVTGDGNGISQREHREVQELSGPTTSGDNSNAGDEGRSGGAEESSPVPAGDSGRNDPFA